jgi:hypothetical protein
MTLYILRPKGKSEDKTLHSIPLET